MGCVRAEVRRVKTVLLPVIALVAGIAVMSLTACTSAPIQPPPTASASPQVSDSPTAPLEPILNRELGAKQNLAYFDFINTRTLTDNPDADGKAFIDGLVSAGFAKADMQVTADRTSKNLVANSIQFSVRIDGDCLIGQNGVGSDGYHSIVTAALATDNCLIGNTRPIDW